MSTPSTPSTPSTVRTEGTARTVRTLESDGGLKDSFLAEIKSAKGTFYNLVVAQAYRIDAVPTGITFTFLSNQKVPKMQCEEQKAWLQTIAEKVAGRPVGVSVVVADAATSPASAKAPAGKPVLTPSGPQETNEDPMKNSTVQAVLEIFPVEKTTIEER
jgi:hypothetical protein